MMKTSTKLLQLHISRDSRRGRSWLVSVDADDSTEACADPVRLLHLRPPQGSQSLKLFFWPVDERTAAPN
jgi:hypothetical protein